MSDAPAPTPRWLYGPLPDLFFGCGLLYAVLCAVFALDGGAFRQIPLVVPVVLISLISMPHYGATLLRVYDRREDRRSYFLFSVVLTLGLVALFGVALFHPLTGSILATVYLSWSAWHYTGQNYGIASMFLRRRGLEIDALTRRLLYVSFVLSFVIVILVMHSVEMPLADPRIEVRLIPLGIPASLLALLMPAVLLAYVGTTLAWIARMAKGAERASDLVPTLLISLTQALWWSVPYAIQHFDVATSVVPLSGDVRIAFFPWIACAHALQYLWITSYYARASGRWRGQAHYYGAVLLAGSAIWTLPALAFAPRRDAFDWNFALLLAATVNIHHFILDGAIWKLRNLKIASVLIKSVPKTAEAHSESQLGQVRKLIWAACAVAVVVSAHGLAERFLIEPTARRSGDLAGAAASLDRQSWLGRTPSAFSRFKLGQAFAATGDLEAAAEQIELSAEIEPRVESAKRLISLYQRQRNVAGVVRSCDRLFELDSVERPMPTPILPPNARAVPPDFWEACYLAAQNARPQAVRGDPTGGAGQDGGLSIQGTYN